MTGCFIILQTIDKNGEMVYTLIENGTDNYVYDETWKDKLISYNGQSITYDEVGNPTNYMGNALNWTMGRQLVKFDDNVYTYNEDGIRTSKTSNGVTTKFYLDGTNIIEQTDGTTTLHFFYDSNDEVIGFRYNGNDYFYVKNQQGDITDITNDIGEIVASYTYDPWGKVLAITGSNVDLGELNPFRYRSYYYDSDIEMYYLQSRYYDPEVGRFINCDDVNYIGVTGTVGSYNAFAYCENNPVNYSDIFGLQKSLTPFQMLYILKKIKQLLPVIIAYIDDGQISADTYLSNPPDHPNFNSPIGGKGWTVQYPDGSHSHAYQGGKMRNHFVSEKPDLKDRIVIAELLMIAIELLADDITGVGVADDVLAVACLAAIAKFKKKVCTVCGEVIYGF